MQDQIPNMPPGTFQTTSTVLSIDPKLHILEAPVDPKWSKSNQQYNEFSLFTNDRISSRSKNYAYAMLKGVMQVTTFSLLYFSFQNIDEIQKLIRYNVFKISNFEIGNQSEAELIIIMRETFIEYGREPQNRQDYTMAIAKLNELVIERALRIVLSAVTQYHKYLYDSTNQPEPISHGTYDSTAGNKSLRETSDIMFAKTTNVYPNTYNN